MTQGRWIRASAAVLAGLLPAAACASTSGPLHVPSPDWRDQVIYFVMTDRFDDGDPSNNDQGAGEYDPGDARKYSGGDLRGLARRIDYVRGLGATAVWITPPVANQWWNPVAQYGGYHGYWAAHFMQVDAHAGSLDDYRALSRTLHGAGMYLVQDVVVNHTGNWFGYAGRWQASQPAQGFSLITDTQGRTAPSQAPFDRNDARDAAQRREGIYHWTPDITDYNDAQQLLTWQLAGLDDLNTEHAAVRAALRESYGFWIREAGVDAYRVDTAFYVPPAYFSDFLHSEDAQHPGIDRVARATGREAFHVFGEGFASDRAYEDSQARRIDAYMRDAAGRALLPGMLNFPLYQTLGDVFARGRPSAELAHRIESMMKVHANPHLMPTFVDNHDVDRFLASGSEAALRQALLAMMTLPGIPTIYYGTEQGFSKPRASMFAAGVDSGGRDRFDTAAPLYSFIQRATALRREHRLFSRGTPTLLARNAAAPGALAWRMDHEGESAIVAFNTADAPTLLHAADTGLPAGTVLEGVFDIDGAPRKAVVGAGGGLTLVLPPRAGRVWRVSARKAVLPRDAAAPVVTSQVPAVAHADFEVAGHAVAADPLRLVVDGRVADAVAVQPGADGRWRARLGTADLVDPAIEHELIVWDERAGAVSAPLRFRVAREWTPLVEVADPAGDDTGPTGRYRYPTDPGWGANRQLDLRAVRVSGSGGAMRIELQMPRVTAQWNPANGFDHVAFTVFIELPGRDGGARVMPLQNASLPGDMRWHLRLRAHGWSNVLFTADGASATHEGAPAGIAPALDVDRERGTVRFTLPASALGRPASLSGARIYVTTWDYDGGYRGLSPQPQPMRFGGGDAVDARVMDDALVRIP